MITHSFVCPFIQSFVTVSVLFMFPVVGLLEEELEAVKFKAQSAKLPLGSLGMPVNQIAKSKVTSWPCLGPSRGGVF